MQLSTEDKERIEQEADWFGDFEIGMMTDKGKIEDLFFLQFDGNCGGWKVREPKGKGLIMATVNGKYYAIGNLKLFKTK